MAPKIKVTKAEIIEAAIKITRKYGKDAVNARSIATELGCSTQPVFSNFQSMDELQAEALQYAYNIYWGFLKKEAESGNYPKYKAFGMAYIRFAEEEKELFKLLFMYDRRDEAPKFTSDYAESVKMIMEANNTSYELAELMHLEMWTCVHGIATMLATSFIKLEWDLISDMISDVYHGIRARHLTEEK